MKFFTPPELSKRWRTTPEKVRLWIEMGELEAVNFGNGTKCARWKVSQDAVAAFEKKRSNQNSGSK